MKSRCQNSGGMNEAFGSSPDTQSCPFMPLIFSVIGKCSTHAKKYPVTSDLKKMKKWFGEQLKAPLYVSNFIYLFIFMRFPESTHI